jgi:purine-binding chemotaxis protein CheW
METTTQKKSDTSIKILHFGMGTIDFAIRLTDVNEVIKLMEIRQIPRVPVFVEGVLHLRGELIIIISLRKLLKISGRQHEKSKIIIFSMFGRKIGFIVDQVSRIIQKRREEILPPPPVILRGPAPDCITGVIEEKGKNLLLLDLKKSLSALEEERLNQVLQRELSFLIDQINEY